jgi:hypothetical protein
MSHAPPGCSSSSSASVATRCVFLGCLYTGVWCARTSKCSSLAGVRWLFISSSLQSVDPGTFGGSSDGEGSSGKGTWYTRAVNGDLQCSLQASVVLFCVFDFLIYVLLLTSAAYYGRS